MNKYIFALAVVLFVVMLPQITNAAEGAKLPSWASSGTNIESKVSSTGQKIATILSAVVGVLSIIGMLIGAVMFSVNKTDQGKQWFINSLIGLFLSGIVFGIASLFA